MPLPVMLIFDIGKTNKKVLLFNRQYELLYEESKPLPESKDEDGFPCEDVHLLTKWVKDSFQTILADDRFTITAINVSAYGASFVHLDDRGQRFLPLYNYLKPYPDDLLKQFYQAYDKDNKLAVLTSSPVLGNLNSGMQLYWLKHTKPDTYKRIRHSLHLPQYISFLLCGSVCSDITSIGCHTSLWNFEQYDYHDWVFRENIIEKLPPLISCQEIAGTINRNIPVGAGLHDSSAALIPYLAAFGEPFILLSTGTWCISLNPFNHTPLTSDDVKNDCLCYLSYQGAPVKASRLFAGNEHEQEIKRLAAHFNTSVDYFSTVQYDPSLCNALHRTKSEQAIKATTAMIEQSSFYQRSLYDFETAEEAYHQLILDIIFQQIRSTKMVMQGSPVKKIFVDGGFSKNDVYMNLLAEAFPYVEVYSAKMAQASAMGAAIAIRNAWNNQPLPHDLISIKLFTPAYNIVL